MVSVAGNQGAILVALKDGTVWAMVCPPFEC